VDALDRIDLTAADLLTRVDDALAGGAPAGHRIWPLLRWIRLLPGEATRSIVALRPIEFSQLELGIVGDRLDGAVEALATDLEWTGRAAEAFQASREREERFLIDPVDSVVDRYDSLGSYVDELNAWIAESRVSLALQLATVLRSAEAVTLVVGAASPADQTARGIAAAEIGAAVLAAIEEIIRSGEQLHEEWAPQLARVHRPRPRSVEPPSSGTTLRFEL